MNAIYECCTLQLITHKIFPNSVSVSSKSFMKANSRNKQQQHAAAAAAASAATPDDVNRTLRRSTTETYTEETFGPLSNVRFAVFALGSSAYPNFCAYGKYVDSVLGDLGGERLTQLAFGDEMCGQEHAFRKWAPDVFKVACETFCLDTDDSLSDASLSNDSLTVDTVRMVQINEREPLDRQLDRYYNKRTVVGKLKTNSTNLNSNVAERSTILVEIQANEVSVG